MHSKRHILLAVQEGRLTPEAAKQALRKLAHSAETAQAAQPAAPEATVPTERAVSGIEPIAIIGISGRFPEADDIDAFWNNLAQGKCSVKDAPGDRGWNVTDYHDPRPQTPGKTYATQGAYLSNVDAFDAKFFGISPREAERMEPSERLFLQESWRAIENAGYSPTAIAGQRWGVFACAKGDYAERIQRQDPTFHDSTDSIAASRLSYLLNLVGPAVTLDTACSSTLAAIAYACDSLTLGNCDVAIAAGGGIYTTPNMLITASQASLFSPTGRSATFDSRADGIVLGEAIGSVVLKPLGRALAAGDPLWGVIRGWGTNQDGRTNGITAPNANAQARLQSDIYRKFGIDPAGITLIEAHGTGTRLGDPIEVQALVAAFRDFTQRSRYCALGSVKPNIGHAFFGAGVAGVIKVLLCLRHGQIPPSIHFEKLNPHIQLDDTPFFITTQLAPWRVHEGETRRAAVNSFGATGINVHLVIEAPPAEPPTRASEAPPPESCLVPFSARTPQQLREIVQSFAAFLHRSLQAGPADPRLTLANIAHTLQVGRSSQAARLAVVTSSLGELAETLQRHLAGETPVDAVSYGVQSSAGSGLRGPQGGGEEAISYPVTGEPDWRGIAAAWARGANVDWRRLSLSRGTPPRRVHLPGYSFAKERHWIDFDSAPVPANTGTAHPLLRHKTLTATGCVFSAPLTGEEFFLSHHRVQGNRVMPGVAYLEMVRAAMRECLDGAPGGAIELSGVVWVQPYIYTPAASSLHIELRRNAQASRRAPEYQFEIYSEADERKVHCKGAVGLGTADDAGALDLARIQREVSRTDLLARDCYARFASLGFELGPRMQGLREIYRGANQVLARLSLPEAASSDVGSQDNAYLLHPALLDSALQACIGFTASRPGGYSFAMDKPALPFVLERMEVLRPCPERAWVCIRAHEQNETADRVHRFDLHLCDDEGRSCVRMLGFSSSELRRALGDGPPAPSVRSTSDSGLLLLAPAWVAAAMGARREWADAVTHRVLLCELPDRTAEILRPRLEHARVSTLRSSQTQPGPRFIDLAAGIFEWAKQALLERAAREPVVLQVIAPSAADDRFVSGLAGVLAPLAFEQDRVSIRLILTDGRSSPDVMAEADATLASTVVRYANGAREVLAWRELATTGVAAPVAWRDESDYLITGGLHGITKILLAEIARSARNARIILTGGAPLTADQHIALAELRSGSTAQIDYTSLDLGDLSATRTAVAELAAKHGPLRGIFHCVKVDSQTAFALKTSGEYVRALEPIVLGALHLDEASADLELDFFAVTSSSAAALGYACQPEETTAQAFLSSFAEHRNQLVSQRRRKGRTLAIAWPALSHEYAADDEYPTLLRHNTGITALPTAGAVEALHAAWPSQSHAVTLVCGDLKQIRGIMGKSWLGPADPRELPAPEPDRAEALREGIERTLIQAIAQVNKLSPADVDVTADLGDLGFDSISLTTLGDVLNREYGLNLLPTSFFEHPTVAKFTTYLLSEHAQVFHNAWRPDETEIAAPPPAAQAQAGVAGLSEPRPTAPPRVAHEDQTHEPIAIVGMSGRFPMARDVAELWDNLAAGRDCISEIPGSRWDWRAIYGDPRQEPDRTHIKWGGFIDGVDEFDPLFFNIPPRDAEHLDPQHRLLMMYVWSAIEDAGYAPGSLAGTNTAIYIGTAGDMGYGDLVSRATGRDYAPPPVSMAPNRMSYFLDLRGPSEPIETACSSSLVAIHRAVVAIRAGLCDMAIAGGVQTIVTPAKHISFSKSGLLCEDGRCKAFSARANGFVRGEGVGMLMLKRLSDAQAAGDHIYAVIRGTAENHGGRASSFTAPNPVAQAQLLKAAYREAAVDIGTVSYIEAHGTGTELGDPIEINGLKSAFAELLRDSAGAPQAGFCGLGSVKSNIGHLEIAAGVAGVIKVLLQMQQRTLAKSLHCEEINPYIQLEGSPFYIVRERQPWTSPQDSAGRPLPRRAGVSSFGIGGANAHVVLEEFIPPQPAPARASESPAASEPAVILLSAKTPERLKDAAQNLLSFIQRDSGQAQDLRDIAYTLQVGRDGMDERLAFLATTMADLEAKLRAYLAHTSSIQETHGARSARPGAGEPDSAANRLPLDLRRGHARRHKEILKGLDGDEDLGDLVEKWVSRRKLGKLLDLWVNGLNIDWTRLYRGDLPRRVSLPTYPFERERYWVNAQPQFVAASGNAQLHPLLHRNTSDLSQQRFTSTLSGREFFLADHVVQNVKILPGVAYLEMVRAAVEQSVPDLAADEHMLRLRHVAWIRPLAITAAQAVHIALAERDDDDQIQFEIFTEAADDGGTVIHCAGVAEIGQREPMPRASLDALRLNKAHRIPGEELYKRYADIGIDYGPGHRGVVQVQVGAGEALGELRLPESVRAEASQYSLHPALLDSALQISLALSLESTIAPAAGEKPRPVLPFALERLEQFAPCAEKMWAHVKLRADTVAMLSKVDVDLFDEAGNLCVRLSGLASRVLAQELAATEDLLLAEPSWREEPATRSSQHEPNQRRWVLVFEREEVLGPEIERRVPGSVCTTLRSATTEHDVFTELASRAFADLQSRLKGDALLVQWVAPANVGGGALAALSGLLRTMTLENPRFTGQLITMDGSVDARTLCERLLADGEHSRDRVIRYAGDVRQVQSWEERSLPSHVSVPWRNGGTYLITGGLGGIGRALAREILTQADKANVVLVGRTEEAQAQEILRELRTTGGGSLEYRRADVCGADEIEHLVADVVARFGSVQGVLHCAGVLRDSFLIKKTAAQFKEALAPKVAGTIHLDRATQALDLDCFVLFSSAAAVLGNFGQGDYAVANAFLGEFARRRNAQVTAGVRSGHTLCVDWPLWRDGGMKISAAAEEKARAQFGLSALSTQTAHRILYFGLQSRATELLALSGQPARLRELLAGADGSAAFRQRGLLARSPEWPVGSSDAIPEDNRAAAHSSPAASQSAGSLDLEERARAFFASLLSSTLKIPAQKLRAAEPMEKYGIDSIVVMELTHQLETQFGSLSKTLFFEHQTLGELAGYFLRAYPERMRELLKAGPAQHAPAAVPSSGTPASARGEPFRAAAPTSRSRGRGRGRRAQTADVAPGKAESAAERSPSGPLDIAIVGLSGRYPLARDLKAYWENLRSGRDCITEVPESRWDWRRHYDPEHQRPGAHYSKWGGFIDGMDEFDPLFFNISPREAEYMDPQERLFLMQAWAALEDAGYTRASLRAREEMEPPSGASVGVYAGVMYVEYQLFGAEQTLQGNPLSLSGSAASVANRVSYILGVHGPSLTVDTMCSSSLTAIHLACQDLKAGRTSLAIAGGVNLTLHANKYLLLSSGQFIATNGRCTSFGAGGDGYIPGEGVGVVVLKRLADAERSGDHIYGVIKGSAINHGGKTNGYSVPNPAAQKHSIATALREAQIDARDVSYVEAHGTGTQLGDPIEITGLTNAFAARAGGAPRAAEPRCWIGSAKSNIGHCEAAAGVAGLTKVLLQFQHGQIAPSLHAQELNPNINFAATPFQVNQVLRAWERPLVTDEAGVSRTLPRIAGVSSFGAGGSNAHLVIEEYRATTQPGAEAGAGPELCVLSARSKAQLNEYAQSLHAFLETAQVNLREVCHTLQAGREAQSERLALVVHSLVELRAKLAAFLKDPRTVEGLYQGVVNDAGAALTALADDADLRNTIRSWMEKRKLVQLAELWVQGTELDWSLLYADAVPSRVSLPTYPFARERYWIPNERSVTPAQSTAQLHPLLHRNTSQLLTQRFSSTFSGEEFFLADHRVGAERVLPAVAYLEMARGGLQKASGIEPAKAVPMVLEHVAWAQPLIVTAHREVHLELHPEHLDGAGQSAVTFEIYTLDAEGQRVAHAQGRMALSERVAAEPLNVRAFLADSALQRTAAEECYARFESAGLYYGPRHRGLLELHSSGEQVLARLRLPAEVAPDAADYVLHPSLLDSALQACIGFSLAREAGDSQMYLPFSVERVEVHRACEPEMWTRLRRTTSDAGLNKVDIDLYDAEGALCARLVGLASRAFVEPARSASASDAVLSVPRWVEAPASPQPAVIAAERHIVLCELEKALAQPLQQQISNSHCITMRSEGATWAVRYGDLATQLLEYLKRLSGPVLLQFVIPNSAYGRVLQGLSGLLRSVELETSRVVAQTIAVDAEVAAADLAALLGTDGACPSDQYIRHVKGQRRVLAWEALSGPMLSELVPWREGGIYLITGGMGGLGRIFAREIIERTTRATILLVGRTRIAADALRELCDSASARGNTVLYRQADVGNAEEVHALVERIVAEHGTLHGVLHSAGVPSGGFIVNKSGAEMAQALRAKVAGTENLDHATRLLDLDCFVLFSSSSAVTGGMGQADYACANGFLDAFARHRDELVAAGQRSGSSVSIGWPLWADGGMRPTEPALESMERLLGWRPMSTRTGIEAFYASLGARQPQVLVQAGDAARIRAALAAGRPFVPATPQAASVPVARDAAIARSAQGVDTVSGAAALENFAAEFLTGLLARTLRLPASRIDRRTDLEQYGLESKLILGMTNELEKLFGPLPKTLFFEYRNISEASRYFMERYSERLLELSAPHQPPVRASAGASSPAPASMSASSPSQRAAPNVNQTGAQQGQGSAPNPSAPARQSAGIAIIGLSGRYPQAENLEVFWRNLRDGRDCIEEIPAERWDWRAFSRESADSGAPRGRWGGFIDGVDQFDPLFFNISPHEARYLDPQERLFLEHAWTALEDAAYTRENLKPQRVGVYAGVMYSEYQLFGVEETARGNAMGFASSIASIANRVSYVLNLRGPSITLDTMCSSSLTAIHAACQDLLHGETSLAIAGGVNVSVHPNKYLALSSGRFLSSQGRCTSFGADGDGYVPGEGVGVVILKRLEDAERDNDCIYGVIRGSAINHGGKSGGYSVPNPTAQREVIEAAFARANVDPRAVSYIETHGTGTKLGDPIEISSLTQAFERSGAKLAAARAQCCWIGSVKSNIGHCEAAAGIAGLTKVLLQMQHGEIVPSLHSSVLNPYIDFAATPFQVNQTLRPWNPPALDERTAPKRIAGVSSFGAGGANAHLLVEDYLPSFVEPAHTTERPCIVPLSARTAEQLTQCARNLLSFIDTAEARGAPLDLRNLSFTLQVGREALAERLAFVVRSIEELRNKLAAFVSTPDEAAGAHRGRSTEARWLSEGQDEGIQSAVATWIANQQFSKLLEFWVRGLSIDWTRLYGDTGALPRRMRLPTYPFAKERYWIEAGPSQHLPRPVPGGDGLHPLVHRNTSDFFTQRYSSTFTGNESVLADHAQRLPDGTSTRLLPAAAYLEMARVAMQDALGHRSEDAAVAAGLRLNDVVWLRPFSVTAESRSLHVRLSCDADGGVSYQFYADSDETATLASGAGAITVLGSAPALDLSELQRTVAEQRISAQDCYQRLAAAGLEYGPTHRAIRELFRGGGQVLARLELPREAVRDNVSLTLHPSLVDAALQASIGLTWSAAEAQAEDSTAARAIPFALDELDLFAPCAERMWAWVRQTHAPGLSKLDIDLLNDSGAVCVRLKGLTSRSTESRASTAQKSLRITAPRWTALPETGRAANSAGSRPAQRWIVLCEQSHIDPHDLKDKLPDTACLPLRSAETTADLRFTACAAELMELLRYLFALKNADGTLRDRVALQVVVPNDANDDVLRGLVGLIRSARLENTRFQGQLVQVSALNVDELAVALDSSWRHASDLLRWDNGQFYAQSWIPARLAAPAAPPPWKHQGVYLITGGLGGLGRLFCEAILRTTGTATVILCGRSALDAERQQQLAELRQRHGARAIHYKAVDIADATATQRLIRDIVGEHGALHGILHSAGTRSDSFLTQKSERELRAVLAPKVAGTLHLNAASRAVRLDFFALFSSATALYGGLGQSDYALANAFLDEFAALREREREAGLCFGQTLAIDWPYWKDGGMRMDARNEARMREETGLAALETAAGLQSFYFALASGEPRVLVEAGEAGRIERYRAGLTAAEDVRAPRSPDTAMPATRGQEPGAVALEILKDVLAAILNLPAERIREDEPLEAYGLNSVMAMDIIQRLEAIFGKLSKTLLYEYQTLQELSRHFVKYHSEALVRGRSPAASETPRAPLRARLVPEPEHRSAAPSDGPLDIAIVGLSGRYPQADDLKAFWDLLRSGTDGITQIPAERWQTDTGPTGAHPWGGFISGVEEFDPLFFRISPRDADHMDPQERLFLQHAWFALQDAGYTRAALQERAQGRVGVYAGVMNSEYHLLALETGTPANPVAASASYASIANRVSYALNLTGPSMTVDTMCSSSLTCVHLACQDLRLRRTHVAVAGGVNLNLHPNKFAALGTSGFLSTRGRCESFGEKGDGYVPSEGVGVVVLKRLEDALADRDAIYGVIKGSALNHGGKTNGYTVPNPNAQQAVIAEAIAEAGIDPRAISYIEAHGTGTKLGDPIEITGLRNAFAQAQTSGSVAVIADSREHAPVCWLGSVKSNIGHCESAAGIAALTKVLLQMRHAQIVPSLHSAKLNDNLDFGGTPFQVNQTLRDWPRLIRSMAGVREALPRVAGISSFGAGGSNAHLIVEEYAATSSAAAPPGPFLIPLAALDDELLKEYAQRLRQHIADARPNLADMAYTLQTGREPMPARLGIVARDVTELAHKLTEFLSGEANSAGRFHARARRDAVIEDAAALITSGQLERLMEAWVDGLQVDWSALYADKDRPARTHLPACPLARHRHWLPGAKRRGQRDGDFVADSPGARRVLLTPSWVESRARQGESSGGPVIVLHSSGTRALARALFRARTAIEAIPIAHEPSANPGVDFYSAESGARISESIIARAAQRTPVGLIDLTAYDPDYERSSELEAGKIRLLQAIVEHLRHSNLRLLQVTCLRAPFKVKQATLSGARLCGLYRMLSAEYATVRSATMDTDVALERPEELAAQIETEFLSDTRERDSSSCYREGRRYELRLEESALTNSALRLSDADVVLVTGGTRGLGRAVVEHLVTRGARRLVVLGREPLPELSADSASEKAAFLGRLKQSGVQVRYFNPALTDRAALLGLVRTVRETLGPITQVFHCAGVSGQSPAFYRKSPAEWARVYEPKVQGLVALHEALKNEPVARFVLFSSVTSVLPELAAGHSDYAAANAFMDCFAARHPLYIRSVQWPAWAETGMAAGLPSSAAWNGATLAPLKTAEGLALLEAALASPHVVSAPLLIASNLGPWDSSRKSPAADRPALSAESVVHLAKDQASASRPIDAALSWVRELFARELRLKPEQVDDDKPFEEYGVESIVVAQLARLISEKVATPLDPALLFEHRSIAALAMYLTKRHAENFQSAHAATERNIEASPVSHASGESAAVEQGPAAITRAATDELAVVGIACRLPGAAHYDEFWKLLQDGVSAIAPGPDGRWRESERYPGGWLNDIDYFDPEFFAIPERDARVMDPQMRLLLEESVRAVCDAGYDHRKLAGRKVGVYIGARSQSPADTEAIMNATNVVMALAPNYIATSISRFFDFRGPSSVVDTACSSALSGLSFAADALAAGRIEMALVGAVSLLPSPGAHAMFKARGILSPTGTVRIFDRRADGDVLGEGGGVVLVKRLSDAVRDGNRIYAVVKAIALNNDGRTLGPGSPSIHAQREVLREALARSGRRVEDIGYIEVSGSGSPIVDSVELRALTDCYQLSERALGACHIGSVKPNIGHLLLSSGLAGFLRCVLSVHHKVIPPFLSAREPFAHYDFAASRIVFDRVATPWNLEGRHARIAALSSFPDGGTNAHLIIEEFVPPPDYTPTLAARPAPPFKRRPMSVVRSEEGPPDDDDFERTMDPVESELADILSRFSRGGGSGSLPRPADYSG